MSSGFFAASTLLDTSKANLESDAQMLPKCGACGLYTSCNTPKMSVHGKGKRGILIIGSYPFKTDDETGRPFAARPGQFLRQVLSDIGIDMAEDCWATNAIICHPSSSLKDEVFHCRPNVLKVIAQKKPSVIILLGRMAIESVIGWAWREGVGSLDSWLGWKIPDQATNAWVCPTYHPSDFLKEDDKQMKEMFIHHVAAAIELAGTKPWPKGIPQLDKSVRSIFNEDEAEAAIDSISAQGRPTAVDYETNGLKPEYDGFKVLCCSLSIMGSTEAIAFPWMRRTKQAMKRFWYGDTPKIASNLKYEDRVTKVEYGTSRRIKKWYWDTMMAAHVLDCRPGITSIKFQVYVMLGVGVYNDHIAPFLQGARGSKINLAETEIDLGHLLQYCGEDSLYEQMVAERQIKQLNPGLLK